MKPKTDIYILPEGVPESKEFGDLYFSRDNGLEETKYVFLKGNNLTSRFQGADEFKIIELGFGTGLNFLATLNLWKQHFKKGKRLTYVGVEKFPLSKEQILSALSRWPELEFKLLLKCYPSDKSGRHHITLTEVGVELILLFEDVGEALKHTTDEVNAWFLDGFAPSKNPEMWSDTIFKSMIQHSSKDATFATFTAASKVRKGLEKAGFNVIKQKGYGRKREMLVGSIRNTQLKNDIPNININKATEKKAIVIGSGIAGASAAYSLGERGWKVFVYEKENEVATQASGNSNGILYPRIEALWNNITEFYYQAFNHLTNLIRLNNLEEICEFKECGLLILPQKQEELTRFEKINLHNKPDYVKLLNEEEASKVAGIAIGSPSLYLSRSGMINPSKLCKHLISQPNINLIPNTEITQIEFKDNKWYIYSNNKLIDSAPILIIANSYTAKNLTNLELAEIQKIRGQVTYLPEVKPTLKTVLCYGGYITPAVNGFHHLGATFDKHFFSLNVNIESSYKNIAQLNKILTDFIGNTIDVESLKGRAGIRCYSKDKLPLIGVYPTPILDGHNIPQQHNNGLYLSICHGSRGILSGLIGGEIIAEQIEAKQGDNYFSEEIIRLVNPLRFVLRERAK